jgi:hypothetical protein
LKVEYEACSDGVCMQRVPRPSIFRGSSKQPFSLWSRKREPAAWEVARNAQHHQLAQCVVGWRFPENTDVACMLALVPAGNTKLAGCTQVKLDKLLHDVGVLRLLFKPGRALALTRSLIALQDMFHGFKHGDAEGFDRA